MHINNALMRARQTFELLTGSNNTSRMRQRRRGLEAPTARPPAMRADGPSSIPIGPRTRLSWPAYLRRRIVLVIKYLSPPHSASRVSLQLVFRGGLRPTEPKTPRDCHSRGFHGGVPASKQAQVGLQSVVPARVGVAALQCNGQAHPGMSCRLAVSAVCFVMRNAINSSFFFPLLCLHNRLGART